MSVIINGTDGVQFNDASLQGAAASPFGLKNRIINGDMRIDQRNAGAAVTLTTSAPYTVDRWLGLEDTDGGMTAQQSSDAPTGFTNSVKLTTTSADASLGAAQYARFQQHIEGYNVADLEFGTANAKTVTLSFWVKSSLTGTFAGGLRNYDANRGYPFNYTISSANTWEYKTVTVVGDTTGTWDKTNSGGLAIIFSMGAGSNFQSTVNTWGAGNYFSTAGATSVVGTNGATWYVTGVQLEQNTSATPFERRLYNQELANCQRYYEIIKKGANETLIGIGFGYAGSTVFVNYPFKVTKRTEPTVEYNGASSNLQCLNGSGSWNSSSGGISFVTNIQSMRINCPVSGISSNNACEMRIEGTSYINISAEL
jgi:hypothetical protein